MKKEINRVLGNSLRCILPSFWWKRLLGKMVDKIESAESSASSAMKMATLAGLEASDKQDRLVSGSNIKTINHQSILGSGNIIVDTDKMEKYKTKDDLDANGSLAGGDIAAVVDALLVEKPFTECYQPTRSEIEANPYNKKFTKVDGISLNPDFNPNLISSNYGSLSVKLYSDGKSKGYYKEYPSYLEIECDYNRTIHCWEFAGTSGSGHTLYNSSGFNASNIDRVNNILREGDFRFSYFEVTYRVNVSDPGYTYYYSYNNTFPADATAMIDSFVKMIFAETQNADIYVRSGEWVKLLKEGDVTGDGADITIDSELSDTSENAVQNKAIKAYVDEQVAKAGGGSLSINELDITSPAQIQGIIAKVREGEHDIYWVGSDTQSSSCLSYYIYDDLSLFVVTDYLCMSIFDLQGNKVLVDTKYRIYGPAGASTDTSKRVDKNSVMYRMVADGFISGADCYLHYADNGKDYKVNQCEMTTVGSTTYLCLSAVADGTIIKLRMLNSGKYYDSTTEPLISFDSELSDTSTNAVENKVVTETLNTKADKSDIKTINGVSLLGGGNIVVDVDTSNLATKEELNAYATSESLQSLGLRIQSDMDTDKRELTEAINTKQDKIDDLEAIRSGAALGATSLQSVPAEYITESELSAKKYATTSQLAAKQDTISDLSTIRSNASLGATAIQKVKTINGESLVGDGDVEVFTKALYDNLIEETIANEEIYAAAVNDLNNRVTTTDTLLATETTNRESLQTEVQTFKTQVTENEEVWATSLTDINTRIDNNYQYGEDTYATKESLNAEIQTINTVITDNEEIIAATLTDLNAQIAALNALITDLTNRIETLENA